MTVIDDEIAFLAQLEDDIRGRRFALIASQPSTLYKTPVSLVGVNFFDGSMAPTHVNYKMPLKNDMWAFWRARGVIVARVAFKWERAQPTLGGPLDPAHLADMHAIVDMARANAMTVLWNMHNYGKREGTPLIGATGGPTRAQFADAWLRLATEFKDAAEVIGYGLMNEPAATMPSWPITVQEAVNAIRSVDMQTAIMVGGIGAGHAWEWSTRNGNLSSVTDPANRLVYEAHQYPDQNSSGQFTTTFDYAYNQSWVQALEDPMEWVARLCNNFTTWLGTTRHGILGETGMPSANLWNGTAWAPSSKYDPRWVEAVRRAMVHCADRAVPVFLWTDGIHAEGNLLYCGHKASPPGAVVDMMTTIAQAYPVI